MQEAITIGFGLALVSPWIGRYAGRAAGWLLGLLIAGLTAYLARFLPAITSGEVIRTSVAWFPGLGIHWSFLLDGLSLTFGLLITTIGALVLIYSGGYMAGHRHLARLYAFLLAFMASMLGVVFADNLLTLFVFWELTSLTSYFLIGINHDQPAARSAALQALLVTGGGGLALLAGFVILGQIGGSYELSALALQRSAIVDDALYLPMLLLVLIGAFTKSAQFPFHFWLPNAMEAPTPVSTYLHSATMVKAGVYLLARLGPTIGETAAWTIVVMSIGATTLAIGAAMAVAQTDLKRILAYSTVSILGALTLLIGIGTELAAKTVILLLVAHALYKAALFLVAGAIDHETGTRDIRRLGGLMRVMPITAAAAFLAAGSNAGLPPLFGFLAKEGMYEAIGTASAPAVVVLLVAVIANALLVAAAGMAGWKPFAGRVVSPSHDLAPSPAPSGSMGQREPASTDDNEMTHAHGGSGGPHGIHEAPVSIWLGPLLLALGSLALGLRPAWVEPIVARGASAIRGAPVKTHLSLWHGFNLVLLLSAITLLTGVLIYAYRARLLDRLKRLRPLARWGPDRGYTAGLTALNMVARWQTRFLQSGYLRMYVKIVILTTVGLAGCVLAFGAVSLTTIGWTAVRPYEWVPLALIILATGLVVTTSSRLAAVAALGVVGYNVALIFILFGGPDLAMTQFAVETLTVILFVLVLYRLPRFSRFTRRGAAIRDLIVAGAGGALMTLMLLIATAEPLQSHLSGYFAEQSLPLGKGRNIVNVILVDFRALDTLGEISVLAVAALGIRALMRLTPDKEGES